MEEKKYPIGGYAPQDMFDFMHHEHSTILTQSEMANLIHMVHMLHPQHPAGGNVWVKASERLPQSFEALFIRLGKTKSVATWNPFHDRFIDDAGDFHPADQIEWLDESPNEQPVVKVDREWVNNVMVDFALLYHKDVNKDIANDAAEYLNDKLKEAGVVYVLSDGEQPVVKGSWVKCAERYPGKPGKYKVKREYSNVVEEAMYDGKFTNYNGYRVIEWYDESNEQPVEQNAYRIIQNIQLCDIDAPVFTHSQQFQEHFDYIKTKFLEIIDISNTQPVVHKEWDSESIIGRVQERHKELKSYKWDWRSFYNGWLEGRSDMLQQIRGWGKYKGEQKENDAIGFAEWLNENYTSIEKKEDKSIYVEYGPQEYDKKQQLSIEQLYNEYQKQNNNDD